MEPALVVDLLDEVGKVFSDVFEGFEGHRIDRLDLQRFHEAFGLGIIVRIAAAVEWPPGDGLRMAVRPPAGQRPGRQADRSRLAQRPPRRPSKKIERPSRSRLSC